MNELVEWAKRTIKPGHVVPLIGVGLLLSCCGPCVMLRSCSHDTGDSTVITEAELAEIVEASTKPKPAGKPAAQPRSSVPVASDFTAEERILAESIQLGEWPSIAVKTQMRCLEYLAAKHHPNDTSDARGARVMWYSSSAIEVSKRRQVRHIRVEQACSIWDAEIDDFFADQFRLRD